jgi:uncharacterized protein YnzC (UPF0291/DUF896 family)
MAETMRALLITRIAALSLVAAAVSGDLTSAGQKLSPQDLAGKLSGTWVLNRDLSTGFGRPAGRRGAAELLGARFSAAGLAAQRGGGGGAPADASDLTPEQRAEQAAMRELQQIAPRIEIKATPESITVIDARGERTYAVNDKSAKIEVAGGHVSVKSKWDKDVLKQEFSNTQAKLTETWGLDEAGRLVLSAKVESMTLRTPEQRAVFDRQ